MMTMKNALDQFAESSLVEPLIEMMTETMDEFAEDRKKYQEAIALLADNLEPNMTPTVREVEESINKQTAALIMFSGLLGLKANLDHYSNPIARTFLEVDYDAYLREDMARRLPDYVIAQEMGKRFYEQLSPAQQDQFEAIAEYVNHLETVVPKIAHYYGFLLGNELFAKVIPGYYSDTKLTMQYTKETMDYLGIDIIKMSS